jgi:PEP-CTERM motif
MKTILIQTSAIAVLALFAESGASAANFNIAGPSTTAQTLGSGAGQTGTITDTGSLTVGGGTNAVTITGNNATLTNLGTLEQTGTGRAIRDNTGVTGLTITNGSATNSSAVIQSADGDVIQMNKSPASVILNNYGTMTSLNASAGGSQVVDFNAILSGANTVNNYATGVMRAYEADAVRPGVNGVVTNAGKIISSTTTGSSSDGIDAQNNSGVQITNNAGGLIEGGRHGITGGAVDATVSFTMSVTNNAGATIQGDNGSGINIDGFNANEVVTVVNHGTITGNGHDIGDGADHDGDGVDVDGLVHLTNTGTIRSVNAFSQPADGLAFSEGVTVGGGTIVNSGTIQGSVAAGNTNAVGRGITLSGNDRAGGGRDPIYGDATVTNQAGGLIQGDTDSGIAVISANASGHKVTIDNQAGATIKGGGTSAAAIDASSSFDSIKITNAGKIDGSSSGKALVLSQNSNNTVTISGGAASVLGDMDGGAGGVNKLTFDIGKGNSFSYSGAVTDFANTEVISGRANLSGSIAGPLTVDAGAQLSPGANGVGALAVGDTTLSAGSGLVIDLGQGVNDVLNVTGGVVLNDADLVLDLLSAPTMGESFDILTNDGTDPISGEFSEGSLVTGRFGGQLFSFQIDYAFNADGGLVSNDIRLTEFGVRPVPEPSTWLLMGLGGLIVLGARPLRRAAMA